jgi:3-phosphoshikimate 1-carboxyvinyltransferase
MPTSSSSAVTVAPARRVHGRLSVPGDKSIAHRYALIGALAGGMSELFNYAPGADCQSTLACLQRLGVEILRGDETTLTVMGRGVGHFRSPSGALDAGNSGTTIRMLTGVVAGQQFVSRLTGDESLSRRPMRRVIEPIERMGGRVDSTDGHPPLTVYGTELHGIGFHPKVPSAQVKSAVLLAGLHAQGTTSVTEPARTRDHTELALAAFGAALTVDGLRISVSGGQRLVGRRMNVPGDFSSAAYWLVAAAALPGSSVEVTDVGLNPTRTALLDVLRRYGARVEVEVTETDAGEPRGIVKVTHDRASSVAIVPSEVPALIDELPAIAALGAHGGGVTVSGASELRVKESDRIAALVKGFRALGIPADERSDGFVIGSGATTAAKPPAGGTADAQGDHRMAMSFAIAALAAQGPSTIEGASAVAISYPAFFETLARLVA